jgi:hypothetical protein
MAEDDIFGGILHFCRKTLQRVSRLGVDFNRISCSELSKCGKFVKHESSNNPFGILSLRR